MTFNRLHIQRLRNNTGVLLFRAHVFYEKYPPFDRNADGVVLDVPPPPAAKIIVCHLDRFPVVLVDLDVFYTLFPIVRIVVCSPE